MARPADIGSSFVRPTHAALAERVALEAPDAKRSRTGGLVLTMPARVVDSAAALARMRAAPDPTPRALTATSEAGPLDALPARPSAQVRSRASAAPVSERARLADAAGKSAAAALVLPECSRRGFGSKAERQEAWATKMAAAVAELLPPAAAHGILSAAVADSYVLLRPWREPSGGRG